MPKLLSKFTAKYTGNSGEFAVVCFGSETEEEYIGKLSSFELIDKDIQLGDAFQIKIWKTKKGRSVTFNKMPPLSKKELAEWKKVEKQFIDKYNEMLKKEEDRWMKLVKQ